MYEMQRCIKPDSSFELLDFNHCLEILPRILYTMNIFKKKSLIQKIQF